MVTLNHLVSVFQTLPRIHKTSLSKISIQQLLEDLIPQQKSMRTELKKLIRKELRISTNVISDNDVENLAAALDGDRTGWVPCGWVMGVA